MTTGKQTELRRLIARKGGRVTRRRLDLLETVLETSGHFTPEGLLAELKARGHPSSLATVYRNLPLLEEMGMIRRTCLSEGGGTHYEVVWRHGKPEHHDHLLCARCGKRVEFNSTSIEAMQEQIAREHGFELLQHHLELVGICPDCRGEHESHD
jgi:Fur family ferric uptake transcriptional regulator